MVVALGAPGPREAAPVVELEMTRGGGTGRRYSSEGQPSSGQQKAARRLETGPSPAAANPQARSGVGRVRRWVQTTRHQPARQITDLPQPRSGWLHVDAQEHAKATPPRCETLSTTCDTPTRRFVAGSVVPSAEYALEPTYTRRTRTTCRLVTTGRRRCMGSSP